MRLTIACLFAASLAAQTAQQQTPPSDCAADGTVINSLTGQALPRANVTPNSTNGAGTSTNAEGKWTISNITCGSLAFSAEKGGYIPNSYGAPRSDVTQAARWT